MQAQCYQSLLLLSKQVRELNFYEKSSNFKCKQLIKNILKIPHKSKGTCSLPRFSQWPRRLQPLKGIYRRIIIMILFKKSVSSKSLPMQGKYYGMWTWSMFFQLILVTHGDKGRLGVRTLWMWKTSQHSILYTLMPAGVTSTTGPLLFPSRFYTSRTGKTPRISTCFPLMPLNLSRQLRTQPCSVR